MDTDSVLCHSSLPPPWPHPVLAIYWYQGEGFDCGSSSASEDVQEVLRPRASRFVCSLGPLLRTCRSQCERALSSLVSLQGIRCAQQARDALDDIRNIVAENALTSPHGALSILAGGLLELGQLLEVCRLDSKSSTGPRFTLLTRTYLGEHKLSTDPFDVTLGLSLDIPGSYDSVFFNDLIENVCRHNVFLPFYFFLSFSSHVHVVVSCFLLLLRY